MPGQLDGLDDPRVELFGMLLEAHNELSNEVTRRLATSTSIPVAWLGLLVRLARTPGERLRMSQLAREMTMSTSGLTRLVDRLEAAGHVRREACPDDRRGLWAVLTAQGRDLVATTTPGHLDDLDDLLGGALDDSEIRQLTDLLRTLRNHVRGLTGV